MKKRELTPVELDECRALRGVFLSKKHYMGLTQEKVAESLGMTQAGVSMYMLGKNALNLSVAAGFARVLNVPVSRFSSRLAELIDDLSQIPRSDDETQPAAHQAPRPPIESNAVLIGDLSVWDDGDPLDDDDCEVPYYAEVEFAGGGGMTEVVEVSDRKLRFSNATLAAAGVDCKSAAVARVRGRSMERLIMDGAAIGFDMSDTNIIDGEIYAFNHDGMLRTKYLYRLPGGAVRVSSENGDEYPDEIIPGEKWREEVKMLGRVFWWSTVRRSPRRR